MSWAVNSGDTALSTKGILLLHFQRALAPYASTGCMLVLGSEEHPLMNINHVVETAFPVALIRVPAKLIHVPLNGRGLILTALELKMKRKTCCLNPVDIHPSNCSGLHRTCVGFVMLHESHSIP